MLYALLCYNDEDMVFSWTQAEDDAVMARLSVVHEKLEKSGKLGPSLRLLPTTAATTPCPSPSVRRWLERSIRPGLVIGNLLPESVVSSMPAGSRLAAVRSRSSVAVSTAIAANTTASSMALTRLRPISRTFRMAR